MSGTKISGAVVSVSATENTSTPSSATPAKTVAQLFGSVYSDVNNDAMQGVVITSAGATGNTLGKYQWSSNGANWTDLPAGLTDGTSRYLAKTDLIRFVPSSTNTSSVAKPDLVARLVDDSQASGTLTSGATVDAAGTKNGGTTAISGNTIALSATNTAPVSTDADGIVAGDPLGAASAAGTLTALPEIADNGTFTQDGNTITVSGNTGTKSFTKNGLTFLHLGEAHVDEAATFAFSNAVGQVQIQFDGLNNSTSDFTATQGSIAAGVENLKVMVNGVAYALKASNLVDTRDSLNTFAPVTAVINADGSITAPLNSAMKGFIVIDAASVPGGVINSISVTNDVISGTPFGTGINLKVAPLATPAQTVAELFGSVYSDVNNDAMQGVVITSAGATGNTLGKYQWSSNGTTWTDLPTGLTDGTSKYLAKTDLIRFVASSTNTSTVAKPDLVARLVDDSQASGTLVSGATVDAAGTKNGGTTAISGNTIALSATNTAPVSTDADGLIDGDPLGPKFPAFNFSDFTGNGTFNFNGVKATVSGATGTIISSGTVSEFPAVNGGFLIGDANSDETVQIALDKPASQVVINFARLDTTASKAEKLQVFINGVQYKLTQSNLTNITRWDGLEPATATIDATGAISGSNVIQIFGTITIDANTVPGGVINSVAVRNETVIGDPGGTRVKFNVINDGSLVPSKTVQELFGDVYSDVNNDAMQGVVITSAGTSANQTDLGKYQWSSNGTNWTDLPAGLTDGTSKYLAKTDLIRFVPSSTNTSTVAKPDLVARLVDDSQASGTLTSGATVDAAGTKNGGSTAISGNTVTLSATNNAPVSTDADGIVAGDPLGAATEVATTFSTASITDNGTTSFGSNSVTVSGLVANSGTSQTMTSDLTVGGTFTGFRLGEGNLDETATLAFNKPVSQVEVNVASLGSVNSGDSEQLVVSINGAVYKLTAAQFSTYINGITGASLTPLISANGALQHADTVFINAKFTIKAADVPGGVINSISVFNDATAGGANGTMVRIVVPEAMATPAQTVADLFGSVYSDVNNDAMQGVVITSAGATGNTLGKYQWSSNGTTWTDLPAGLTDGTSKYLAKTDLIRFVPSSTNASSVVKPALTARLVDDSQASGTLVSGATVDAAGTKNGGTTAISGNTVGYAQVDNTAPVLADSTLTLASVAEGNTALPTGAVGSLVSSLTGNINDTTDGAFVPEGIAITAVDTSKGTLYFSLNGGTNWTEVTQTLSNTNALLLSADGDNRLYFKPATGTTGSIGSALTIRGWDKTTGSEATLVDTSTNGGTTAFSSTTDTVSLNLTKSSLTVSNAVSGEADSSESSGQGFGATLSNAGDVNGDGYDDFIVGIDNGTTPSDLLDAYVVFGSSVGITSLSVSSLTNSSTGFSIFKDNTSLLGKSVSGVGDVNGDGLADLQVSAISTQTTVNGSLTTVGRSYIVYGKTSGATVDINSLGAGGQVISADSAGFRAVGTTLAGAGDVNGDGLADMLISNNDPVNGVFNTYVVFGTTNNTEIKLSNVAAGSGGYIIKGSSSTGSGFTNAGDVNGDGLADIVVSGGGDTVGGVSGTGRAYVVYGQTGTATMDVSTLTAGNSSNGFVINSAGVSESKFGANLASVGDVNGDGLADLGITDEKHNAYVVFGKTGGGASIQASNLGTSGFIISGLGTLDQNVNINYAGDLNGDGLADVIASEHRSNKVYVVYGKTDGATVAASSIAAGVGGFVINGVTTASEALGHSPFGFQAAFGYAGDLNGDGYDDLLIGAPSATVDGDGGTGKTYVVYGGPSTTTSPTVLGTGTVSDELVVGTNTADTLTGGGGVDRFSAGAGNDTIVLQASDAVNLAATSGGSVRASVDAGTGFDTLRLSSGMKLDLTTISNVSGMSIDSTSRIERVERIDMATDTAANTLTLAARDVNDMTGFNLIHTGTTSADGKTWTNVSSGTALAATTRFHQLVVDGGSSDVVNLKTGTGTWTNAGTVNDGTNNYVVWQNTSTTSQVIVRSGVTVNANVAPVVLDLNQDGVIEYGNVLMDVNSDGVLDSTLWAGVKDGVLVWDKYHDGQVHNHTQYAFTEYGGSTDLEGLAAGFDSNHDGVLSAADAKFSEFKVWQDLDQDGVSDAGEVRSLADLGITSIDLTSDGITRMPVAGVTEAGQSTAQLADGSSVLVSDAAFEFRSASAAEAASHAVGQDDNVFKLFGGLSLDLSAVTDAAKLTEVNAAADTGANTIKLTLADVLGASGVDAVSGDMHQLMLTGDANDTALLSANEWLSTDTTVTQNDRTYSVYNAANDAATQLLIDQHMAVTHNG